MRVLINALSVTNSSGRHVLLGHLSRFARWTAGRHSFVVLHHAANRDLVRDLGPNVEWLECPAATSGWIGRSTWERRKLAGIVRQTGSSAVYTPAGTTTPGVGAPQIAFAQNPWALVRDLERSPMEHVKAWLQRRAYREAMLKAEVMVFNSGFMHDAYRKNAGCDAKAFRIIYQGIDDETFAAAESLKTAERKRWQIVSVSVMAPHKGVETLVAAVGQLRSRHGRPATLLLIGDWPDRVYRRRIERHVERLGLVDAVVLAGHVTRDVLHRAYATSRVFSLMSRCESFGIPAVEAQAFGTPVVSSNCSAIPEVCGDGGVFPPPRDVERVADALDALLTDDVLWRSTAALAVANAQRYHWDDCSRPYVELFDSLAAA